MKSVQFLLMLVVWIGAVSAKADADVDQRKALDLYQQVLERSFSAPTETIANASEFYALEHVLSDQDMKAMVRSEEAYAWFIAGKTMEALDKAQKALHYAEQQQSMRAMARARMVIGNCFYIFSVNDKALENYLMAETLFHSLDDKAGLLKVYNNIGNVFRAIQSADRSLEYYNKLRDLAEQLDDPITVANAYQGLGNAYVLAGSSQMAEDSWLKAEHIYLQHAEHPDVLSYRVLLYGSMTEHFIEKNNG